jgi:hypothetical protein
MKQIEKVRNAIVHRGEITFDSPAPLALLVANTLLDELFPKLLEQLGLHLNDPVTICDKSHP